MLNIPGSPHLKTALLLPLAAALAVFAAVHLLTFSRQQARHTEEHVDGAFLSAEQVFHSAVRNHSDKLAATLTVIAQDEQLKHAMLAGDRQALLQRAQPTFDSLRKEFGMTHLYFMHPDRVAFLRVHQPERYGDVIDRFTAQQAQSSGKLTSGLELGPLGTFTLRSVVPWHAGAQLIGYLELGEEIGSVLNSITNILGLDLFLVINKSYLSEPDWTQGTMMLNRQAEWGLLPNSVIVYQTLPSTSPGNKDPRPKGRGIQNSPSWRSECSC